MTVQPSNQQAATQQTQQGGQDITGDQNADDQGQDNARQQQQQVACDIPAELQTVRVRDALCPGVRALNGCIKRTFKCSACGHETQQQEQFSHVSLQLPEASSSAGGATDSPNLLDLLHDHFKVRCFPPLLLSSNISKKHNKFQKKHMHVQDGYMFSCWGSRHLRTCRNESGIAQCRR